MTSKQPVRLDARLEILDDHLSGEVRRAGEEPIGFSGWLGLLSAVERACAVIETAEPIPGPQRRTEH